MATAQTAEIFIWGLTFKEFWSIAAIVLAIIAFFFKDFYAAKVEVFVKSKMLTDDELTLMKGMDKGDKGCTEEFAARSQEQQQNLTYSYTLAGHLTQFKATDWSQKYTAALDRLLTLMAKLMGDKLRFPAKPGNKVERWCGTNVFTTKSYIFCLRLALVYPIAFTFLSWLVSGQLAIGGLIFAGETDLGGRIITITGLIVMVGCYRKTLMTSGWQRLLWFAGAVAGAVAVAVAGAFAFAVAFAGAGAVAVVFAFAFAVAFAGAGAVAGAVAGAGAVAVAVAVALLIILDKIDPDIKSKYWLWFNGLFMGYIVAGILIAANRAEADSLPLLLLPVLLGLLPLLNAVVDWCSLNITRGLLLKIRDINHGTRQSIKFAVVDLLLAAGFVFVVTGIVVAVMAGVNSVSSALTGRSVLDFTVIMADLKNPEKITQMLWIHLMVLSTLIPTLLHFLFTLYALILLPKIHWLQSGIDSFWSNTTSRRRLLHYHLFSWTITPVLAIGILWLLILLFSWLLKPIAIILWHWADLLLLTLNTGYKTPIL